MAVSGAVQHARGRAARLQAGLWLAGVLWLAVWIAGARFAREHADLRVDLTQDKLLSLSPVAASLLGRLEDRLQVELYFSGRVESGLYQVAQRQLLEQLRELERLAQGRMQLVRVDPGESAAARLEAQRYGIVGRAHGSGRGSAAVFETVYLGMVLRYRGREAAIPFALPHTLEFAFLEALDSVQSPRRRKVGWLADDAPTQEFGLARDLVQLRFDVEDVRGLAEGVPVPAGLDALVLVRPRALHPRAVFELDQYLARGGRVVMFLDRSLADPAARTLTPIATGLESYLAHLGVQHTPAIVFERGHPGAVRLRGAGDNVREQPYPYFARIPPEGFDPDQPVTQRLPGAEFLWAHPFRLASNNSVGLERTILVRSSERSYAAQPPMELEFDAEALRRAETELLALAKPEPQALVVALAGDWPSPFAGETAPAARDPLGGPDRPDAVRGVGGETAASAASEAARLVLVGDADVVARRGLAEGGLAALIGENRMLLDRLIDWLTLEPELLGLRTRLPRDRSIRNFMAEELERIDLSTLERAVGDRGQGATPAEENARSRARRKEWLTSAAAMGGSLLGVLGLQLIAMRRRRAPLLVRGRST